MGRQAFWFTDAQFITGKEAYPQCIEILERILAEKLEIEWSGYIRTSLITPELAKLMVRSGVGDLEVAITSGSQEVLNNLHMGFKLERLYDGCRYLAEAGFKGKVILNYSLNSPKETEESLLQSVESYKKVASILGEERVFPLMFFLGIQPNTDLEARLLEEGYLSAGYNPLMLTPTSIRKLLYNPAPLNSFIAKACLRAWERKAGKPGPTEVDGIPVSNPERIRPLCRQESDPRDRRELRTRCPPVPGRNHSARDDQCRIRQSRIEAEPSRIGDLHVM